MSEQLSKQGTRLGLRFFRAARWAAKLHREQARKDKPAVPYVSHLLGVAALVLEDSGSEDQAIAAMLHDAVEDQDVAIKKIRRRFGKKVATIVEHATDDLDRGPTEKPKERNSDNWKARKTQYLASLETADVESLRVSAADKLHNARAIVADLRRDGPGALAKFNASPRDQLWYYRSLVAVFSQRRGGFLADELAATVDEMGRLTDVEAATREWHTSHPA